MKQFEPIAHVIYATMKELSSLPILKSIEMVEEGIKEKYGEITIETVYDFFTVEERHPVDAFSAYYTTTSFGVPKNLTEKFLVYYKERNIQVYTKQDIFNHKSLMESLP